MSGMAGMTGMSPLVPAKGKAKAKNTKECRGRQGKEESATQEGKSKTVHICWEFLGVLEMLGKGELERG